MPNLRHVGAFEKRLVTILIFSQLSVFTGAMKIKTMDNRKMYGKIQIVTRRFRVDIQFLFS